MLPDIRQQVDQIVREDSLLQPALSIPLSLHFPSREMIERRMEKFFQEQKTAWIEQSQAPES